MTEAPTSLFPDGRDRPTHLRSWRDKWRSLGFLLFLSPRAPFLYPGFSIFLFGLIAILVLLANTVRIGSITFTQHTLVVTSAAIIIGFQAMEFWAFAKIMGMRHGLLPYDSVFKLLRSLVPLERGPVIGAALMTAGTVAILAAFGYGTSLGFGRIEFANSEEYIALRLVCGGSAALVLRVQIIYGSFFLYLLEYAALRREGLPGTRRECRSTVSAGSGRTRLVGQRDDRKGVFVTTPSRWFPIEFHTLLPLVHWLPPEHFRKLLVLTSRDFFADERNLNLLSMRQLRRIAVHAGVGDWHIDAVSLLGWPTNLLLWAHKPAAASACPPKQEHTARVVSIRSQHCLAIIAADAWSQS